MQPILHLTANQILHEIRTDGHSPLVVSAQNKQWLVKSPLRQPVAYYLASEVVCAYFLELWDFKMPKFGLMHIEQTVLERFVFVYKKKSDYQKPCFAIEFVENAIEINGLLNDVTNEKLGLLQNPIDFLKLALFDIWVENDDRKPSNPNLMLAQNKQGVFDFLPIDHAFTFNSDSYKNLLPEFGVTNSFNHSLMDSHLAQTLIQKNRPFLDNDLATFFVEKINLCATHFDFIIQQLPQEWNLTAADIAQLHNFLFDNNRSKAVIAEFQSRMQ